MAASIDLEYPFAGSWLTQNSPADRVPSHGTSLFGTSYAIDFVPVDDTGRSAPITFRSLVRPEPPERFPGNSTEPHIHVQAIDSRDIECAGGVRLTFRGSLPRNGELVVA